MSFEGATEPLSPAAAYALYRGAVSLSDSDDRVDACCTVLLGGRLGLSLDEQAHLHDGWVDWDRGLLRVPESEPCACAACCRTARRRAEGREQSALATLYETCWQSPHGGRTVSFGWSRRLSAAVTAHVDRRREDEAAPAWSAGGDDHSRRVLLAAAAEAAPALDPDGVGPDRLRATAARVFAAAGVSAEDLAALLGVERAVAERVVRRYGDGAATRLAAAVEGTDAAASVSSGGLSASEWPLVVDPTPFANEPFDPRTVDAAARATRADDDAAPRPVSNPRPREPGADSDYDRARHDVPSYLDPGAEGVRVGVDGTATLSTLPGWVADRERERRGDATAAGTPPGVGRSGSLPESVSDGGAVERRRNSAGSAATETDGSARPNTSASTDGSARPNTSASTDGSTRPNTSAGGDTPAQTRTPTSGGGPAPGGDRTSGVHPDPTGPETSGTGAGTAGADTETTSTDADEAGRSGETTGDDDGTDSGDEVTVGTGGSASLDPRERVTGPVRAEESTRFVVDGVDGGQPTDGHVVLGAEELLFVGREGDATTIPLSAVVDVAVDYVPDGFEDVFDDTVGVAYERDGDRRLAVGEFPGRKQIDAATEVFATLLDGTRATVTHPAKEGGRVTTALPRPCEVSVEGRRIAFHEIRPAEDDEPELPEVDADADVDRELLAKLGTDDDESEEEDLSPVERVAGLPDRELTVADEPLATVEPTSLVHVERGRQTVGDGMRDAVKVAHYADDIDETPITTEISAATERTYRLLKRRLTHEYRRRERRIEALELSEEEKEALVALYTVGDGVDPGMLVDVDPDGVGDVLTTLEEKGLVKTAGDDAGLSALGETAVNEKLDDVNV
ncbi:CheF family chemotaxis protein [Halobaculum sp. MBLA0147]|uniref:CheF family chemotaxis protein n=1 Tax=Halobaculum sp. MBLA0147 TaxID=3079934 RepID=UPI0035259E45